MNVNCGDLRQDRIKFGESEAGTTNVRELQFDDDFSEASLEPSTDLYAAICTKNWNVS